MTRNQNCHNQTAHIWTRELVLSLGIPHIIMTIISVVFNSAVILSVVCAKDLQKPIFLLFCNLAFSDLLSSASGFWVALFFMRDPQSTVVGSRKILRLYAFYAVPILATIYNLVAIGIERYLALAEKRWTRRRITRNQVLGIVLAIWLVALFLGFMPLMGWNCLGTDNVSTLYSPLCINYLAFITIPHSTVSFIIPFFTYLSIILFLRKHKVSMGALGQARSVGRLAEIQVARTSILIWITALLSYMPFFVAVVLDLAMPHCPTDLPLGIYIFRNLTSTMIAINSLGNPIIYTLNVKRLGRRIKALKQPSINRIDVQVVEKM
ncbi:lysophosphatidic acid receptor 1-A-like [Anolis sagrei]|uniref:lysophosphatidic acid receptor 1-A-like n=1 Tax=Anolis sagrei TaxID=38937 RepID=UPI00351FDFB1